MGRRGRKRQLAVEDEYWQLILSGVGTVEACRRVGVTRKTGYRWRAERGGLAPVRVNEADRGSRYLSRLERHRIASLRSRGLGVREIGSTSSVGQLSTALPDSTGVHKAPANVARLTLIGKTAARSVDPERRLGSLTAVLASLEEGSSSISVAIRAKACARHM